MNSNCDLGGHYHSTKSRAIFYVTQFVKFSKDLWNWDILTIRKVFKGFMELGYFVYTIREVFKGFMELGYFVYTIREVFKGFMELGYFVLYNT